MNNEVKMELMWQSTEMPGFPLEKMGDADEHSTQPIKLEKVESGAGYGGQGFETFLIQFGAGVSTSLIATYIYDKIVEKASEDPVIIEKSSGDPVTNVEFRIDGDYNDVTVQNLEQSIQESLTEHKE